MKKVCPKDPSHDFFITSAVICQTWLVEECTDVFHRPSTDNIWQCAICGAEAVDPELKLIVDN